MQHSEDPAILSSSPAEESDNPLSAAPVDPQEPQSLPGLDGTPVRCESPFLSVLPSRRGGPHPSLTTASRV